jgi:hypothetical protein
MGRQELDNLVKIQRLKTEPPTRSEYNGMLESARKRLVDAQNEDLDRDSQFDLAYGAAHRLALAALRREGYRSEDRVAVCLPLMPGTCGVPAVPPETDMDQTGRKVRFVRFRRLAPTLRQRGAMGI